MTYPAEWSKEPKVSSSVVVDSSVPTQSNQISADDQEHNQTILPNASLPDFAPHSNIQNQIPELLISVESLTGADRELAEQLADAEAARFEADTFLRWSPVIVEDLYAFISVSEGDDATVYTPTREIQLTPFPGTTITAENLGFRAGRHTLSWRGQITSGGSGRISVHLTTVREGEKYMAVSITSDVGAFRVRGLEGSPYHIAMELNPAKNP